MIIPIIIPQVNSGRFLPLDPQKQTYNHEKSRFFSYKRSTKFKVVASHGFLVFGANDPIVSGILGGFPDLPRGTVRYWLAMFEKKNLPRF